MSEIKENIVYVVGRNDFEERQEEKLNYYEEKASKASKSCQERLEKALTITKFFPMGQPILCGHHSEGQHRSQLKKSDNNMRKSIEESGKAEYYERKVENINNSKVISSDDPQALEKLTEKLNNAIEEQEFMKACNKYYRKYNTLKGINSIEPEKAEKIEQEMNDCHGKYNLVKIPFKSFSLSNNNQNIKSIRERIQKLENIAMIVDEKILFEGGYIHINKEINRVQIVHEEIPDEEKRKKLKSNGFNWSRNEKAWQRLITKISIRIAKEICL